MRHRPPRISTVAEAYLLRGVEGPWLLTAPWGGGLLRKSLMAKKEVLGVKRDETNNTAVAHILPSRNRFRRTTR